MSADVAPQDRGTGWGAVAASGMGLTHRDLDRGLGQHRSEGHVLYCGSSSNSINNSKPVIFNLFVFVVLGMKPRALHNPGKHSTPKPYAHMSPVEKLLDSLYTLSHLMHTR